jgi:hypothetical protein
MWACTQQLCHSGHTWMERAASLAARSTWALQDPLSTSPILRILTLGVNSTGLLVVVLDAAWPATVLVGWGPPRGAGRVERMSGKAAAPDRSAHSSSATICRRCWRHGVLRGLGVFADCTQQEGGQPRGM